MLPGGTKNKNDCAQAKHEHRTAGSVIVGNTYISSVMLDCKCSPRKLWFGKPFVVLELFIQLLRQCLMCGLWKHAGEYVSPNKVTVVSRMHSQN